MRLETGDVLLNIVKYCSTMDTILSAQQKWSINVLMALVLLACYLNSIRVRYETCSTAHLAFTQLIVYVGNFVQYLFYYQCTQGVLLHT